VARYPVPESDPVAVGERGQPNGLAVLDGRARVVPDLTATAFGLKPRDLGVVIDVQGTGFEQNMVEGPTVWWDEARQKWGAIYVGYNLGTFTAGGTAMGKLGLAWSDDLVTWTRDPANPIFSPTGNVGVDPDGGSITGPFMWVEGGTYYLFYLGCDNTGYEKGNTTIMLATASSPTGPWTRRGAMIAANTASWNATNVWRTNIVKVGSTYHLFFNGTAADTKERIGHASAQSLTGPWTVDPNPVLDVGGAGAFDENHVADPSVYRVGNYWAMHYAGVDNSLAAKDGLAWCSLAEFPSTWHKHIDNPILSVWVESTFQNQPGYSGGRPFIVNTPHGHHHFYIRQWPSKIGLAVQGAAAGLQSDRQARQRPWVSSDNLLLASNFDPIEAVSSDFNTLGFVTVTKVWLPDTVTVANLHVIVTAAGVGLVNGQCLGGLYRPDGTLIATTATQHTNWQDVSNGGVKAMPLTAQPGHSLTLEGGPGKWVYAAFVANGTTAPKFATRGNLNGFLTNLNLIGDVANGMRSGFKATGGQTTLPAALGAVNRWTGPVWVGLS
jgi:predicted GH43/DUF377 family glycosyl hydrolase